MEIVGNGFLARSLGPIGDRHPHVVALAAGVSWAGSTGEADFTREAALLDEVARQCSKSGRLLLFFSTASSGMYGAAHGPGREDEPVSPVSPYGAHKLALERQLRSSAADYLVLRLGHLTGPGQPAHQMMPTLVRQLRAGRVSVHLRASRDLIGVADVITVIDRMLARDLRGETINVASGEAVPVPRIVDHLEHRLGTRARREYEDVGSHHLISIEKLRSVVPEIAELGFGPEYYRKVIDGFVEGKRQQEEPIDAG
jgi:NDP-hexose 4-ketoreductase